MEKISIQDIIYKNPTIIVGFLIFSGFVQRIRVLRGGAPNGNRTRVSALRGPRPGPLDDGGLGGQNSTTSTQRRQFLADEFFTDDPSGCTSTVPTLKALNYAQEGVL